MADDIEMEEDFADGGVITLVDEEGKEIEFNHIATVDYENEWYIVLEPVETMEGMEDGDVIIYQLGTDEDGIRSFIPIEDEELLNKVFDEFVKLMEEEECDCEDCAHDEGCDCGCHHEKE